MVEEKQGQQMMAGPCFQWSQWLSAEHQENPLAELLIFFNEMTKTVGNFRRVLAHEMPKN